MRDLSDILSKEVEVSGSAAIIDEAVTEAPIIDEEEIIETTVQTEHLHEIPNTERPKAMPHNHFAETIVGIVDGLQSSLIPMWRKQSLFTQKERDILDGLDTTGGTVYSANSPEFKILSKWNKHLQMASMLPFTPAEKERLVAATERYANTMQIQVSPFTGLLMAFGEVAGTRVAYFLND
jgi:hypothetical protein